MLAACLSKVQSAASILIVLTNTDTDQRVKCLDESKVSHQGFSRGRLHGDEPLSLAVCLFLSLSHSLSGLPSGLLHYAVL
jgi:hypothetical protein